MVQPHDSEFKEYQFKIKDFLKLLDVKDQSKYIEIPKITKDLMKKAFEIKEGKKIIQIAWLSSVVYETGEGTVILKFDSNLKPYMLELKELYTSYRLDNVLSLKSKYSIRLYEILKSNLFKKNIEIELEEIKNMVGAKEKTYNTYGNFKSKILIQTQKELKNKTDISFEFEEIKTGRKVTSIKFYITSNKNTCKDEIAVALEVPQENLELGKQVQGIFIEHKLTAHEASCILKDANNNINLIQQCYTYSLGKDIKNIVGYIRKLAKGFNEPKENIKKGSFTEYEQREYDFDELEKKLLGWDNND